VAATSLQPREAMGHQIQNYLITPIQRLPRYVMLLQELLKFTLEKDADFAELSEAIKKLMIVANYVNDKKREVENLHAV